MPAVPLELRFSLAEEPGFLEQFSIEVEDDGNIILGVYNRSGHLYAFTRLEPKQFRRYAAFALAASGDIDDGSDPL